MPPAGDPKGLPSGRGPGRQGAREGPKHPANDADKATGNPKTTEKGMEKPKKRKIRPNFDELTQKEGGFTTKIAQKP